MLGNILFTLSFFLLSLLLQTPFSAADDSIRFIPADSEPIRVLILSAPFGAGHNAAQKRIAELLRQTYGTRVEVIEKNTLDFSPEILAERTLRGFEILQSDLPKRYTALFNQYVKQFEHVDAISKAGLRLYQKLGINLQDLERYMIHEAFKDARGNPTPPTIVFSTWPGSTEALIDLKEKSGLWYSHPDGGVRELTFTHVQTDNGIERYFELLARGSRAVLVPSQTVFDHYQTQGLNNAILTGMPLIIGKDPLPSFEERQVEMRQARRELGLDPDRETILIEAGKNGAANFAAIITAIIQSLGDQPINVIAGCGTDADGKKRQLLNQFAKGAKRGTPEFAAIFLELKELFQPINLKSIKRKEFDVFGLKPNLTKAEAIALIERGIGDQVQLLAMGFGPISSWRKAATLVVTKPGGLSTAEMGANGNPMLIMQEYASGEALPNGPIFEKNGLARVVPDVLDVGRIAAELLKSKRTLSEMHANSQEYRKTFHLERALTVVEAAYQEEQTARKPKTPKQSRCAALFSSP